MNEKKRKALEAAGFQVGDAGDFLGLSTVERGLIELRLRAGREIRRLRQERSMTQKQLAALLVSSQSRVARIEAAEQDVSLDLLIRGYLTVGGDLGDLLPKGRPSVGKKKAVGREHVAAKGG